MKVFNKTTYPIIAFCYHTDRGYGDDVRIEPGKSGEVSGPYVGKIEEEDCFLAIPGELTCHEAEDNINGWHVSQGRLSCLKSDKIGITIRHHLDERDV